MFTGAPRRIHLLLHSLSNLGLSTGILSDVLWVDHHWVDRNLNHVLLIVGLFGIQDWWCGNSMLAHDLHLVLLEPHERVVKLLLLLVRILLRSHDLRRCFTCLSLSMMSQWCSLLRSVALWSGSFTLLPLSWQRLLGNNDWLVGFLGSWHVVGCY